MLLIAFKKDVRPLSRNLFFVLNICKGCLSEAAKQLMTREYKCKVLLFKKVSRNKSEYKGSVLKDSSYNCQLASVGVSGTRNTFGNKISSFVLALTWIKGLDVDLRVRSV